jgi:hypothetical protein
VYTAVDIPASEMVVASNMFAIPFFDGPWWTGQEYSWSSGVADRSSYEDLPGFETNFLAGLFGGMSNSHAGIANLREGKIRFDPILDRRIDPGAGAFTDHLDFNFKSAYSISAGEELFIDYGSSWYVKACNSCYKNHFS